MFRSEALSVCQARDPMRIRDSSRQLCGMDENLSMMLFIEKFERAAFSVTDPLVEEWRRALVGP